MLIMLKGRPLAAGDDWDEIEGYAAKAKTKVTKVTMLPVVGGMVELWVHWKNGAIGNFTGESFADLEAYILTLKNWPKPNLPRMMAGPLPFISGRPDEEEAPAPEPVVEEAPRIRRTRRKK